MAKKGQFRANLRAVSQILGCLKAFKLLILAFLACYWHGFEPRMLHHSKNGGNSRRYYILGFSQKQAGDNGGTSQNIAVRLNGHINTEKKFEKSLFFA